MRERKNTNMGVMQGTLNRMPVLRWKSCKMEPDFWYRVNGEEYEFRCIWLDNILIASKRNDEIHDDLKKLFKVKGGEFSSYRWYKYLCLYRMCLITVVV